MSVDVRRGRPRGEFQPTSEGIEAVKKSTPSENYMSSKRSGLRRGLFAVFAGILFLGVFAPEKTSGADKKDTAEELAWITHEEFVWITRFRRHLRHG